MFTLMSGLACMLVLASFIAGQRVATNLRAADKAAAMQEWSPYAGYLDPVRRWN